MPPLLEGSYSISGSRVLYDGEPIELAGGVNAMHTFGLRDAEYERLTSWNVKIVREFIGNLRENPITGDWASQSSIGQWLHPLQKIVANNRANGLITLLCPFAWTDEAGVTTEFGGRNPSTVDFYDDYKVQMVLIAEQFKDQTDVWVEVWNEPYHWQNLNDYSEDLWLSDALDMVGNLRGVQGFDNVILVQGNGMGQLEDAILAKGQELLDAFSNVMFDLHGYEEWMIRNGDPLERLNSLRAAGFAVLFGEIGVINSSGLMDAQTFLSAALKANVPTLGWLWKYDGSDKNALLDSDGNPNDADNNAWGSTFKAYLAERLLSTSFPSTAPTSVPTGTRRSRAF
jgi:mannan endo-1,4-beta-mannosidase